MCGFIVTNQEIPEGANRFNRHRGPDGTTITKVDGITFIHNLLHITGGKRTQPFTNGDCSWVFNGEIYNYWRFGDYETDGECIGDVDPKLFDGEFAIVEVMKDQVIISLDTFATKPVWVNFKPGKFCVASYKSSVPGDAVKLGGNATYVYDIKSGTGIMRAHEDFDVTQKKDTYDDWIIAFERSIEKRTRNVGRGMFMGLSSGYDSGGIACEMNVQKVDYDAYTVAANETKEIIEQRGGQILRPTKKDYNRVKQYIKENCEDFKYRDKFNKYNIKKDKASVGLGLICEQAQKKDQRVYFSGHGADEIMSDYGFNGRKFMSHSEFGGKFPRILEGFFPWHSFFDGTQIKYLNKEEYVAGTYGIETRYPYLDRALVQEFLWLTPELKNRHYKAPLHEYFRRNNYPFEEGVKKGFRAKDNLK